MRIEHKHKRMQNLVVFGVEYACWRHSTPIQTGDSNHCNIVTKKKNKKCSLPFKIRGRYFCHFEALIIRLSQNWSIFIGRRTTVRGSDTAHQVGLSYYQGRGLSWVVTTPVSLHRHCCRPFTTVLHDHLLREKSWAFLFPDLGNIYIIQRSNVSEGALESLRSASHCKFLKWALIKKIF